MRRGAAARYNDDVLEMLYGSITEQEDSILPPPMRPQRLIYPVELDLVLQNHAFLNWLRSYKMVVPVNCPIKDLTLFHRLIKPKLLN